MKKHILVGVFLTGILMIGIGTGIAFGEYSSFSYGGQEIIGTGNREVETEEYMIPLSGEKTRVCNYTNKEMNVVEDKSLKDGQVRIEVISNPDYVRTYMDYYEYGGEYEEYDDTGLKEIYRGEISVHFGRIVGDLEIFMECKDDFLDNLKNKVIKNYYLEAVESVTVKANAATLKFLEY